MIISTNLGYLGSLYLRAVFTGIQLIPYNYKICKPCHFADGVIRKLYFSKEVLDLSYLILLAQVCRIFVDFRNGSFRLRSSLYRAILTNKFQPNRFLKNRFLLTGFFSS